MTSNRMPGWLVAVLTVVGVVFLGPPALVLLLVALGLALKVSVIALKVCLVALAVAAVVFVVRALFGGRPAPVIPERRAESIEEMAERIEADERRQREALDRQLAEALQGTR